MFIFTIHKQSSILCTFYAKNTRFAIQRPRVNSNQFSNILCHTHSYIVNRDQNVVYVL